MVEPKDRSQPQPNDRRNQAYYDAFSASYEAHRGENDPGGYHELLDELEAEFVARFAKGRDVLEVGCGTGLLLQRIQGFAGSCKGLDLSPGMLEKARARGLDVVQGSATSLPFPDQSFDVACAFKVLAHIEDIRTALAEMARVTRPGGYVIAEFYNPHSLRGLVKRYLPSGTTGQGQRESDVYTRFDPPSQIPHLCPQSLSLRASRGIRILVPTAHVMRVRGVREALRFGERLLADSPLKRFAGFYLVALRKR